MPRIPVNLAWAAEAISRLGERMIFIIIPIIPIGVLCVLLYALVSDVRGISWVKDHGRVTEGIVVDGKCGSGMDYTHYCSEDVEFKDELGNLHRTSRSCGNRPNMGARVTVRYAPSNPTHARVEGDDRWGGCIFGIIMIALVGIFRLGMLMFGWISGALRVPPDDPRPRT